MSFALGQLTPTNHVVVVTLWK